MCVEEALALADALPLALQLNVFPRIDDFSHQKDSVKRKVVQQLRDNAIALGGLQFEARVPMVATLGANTLDDESGHCPALADDGRCQIHPRRPRMCRAVPFNPEIDPRLSMRIFYEQYRHDCDWSSAAPSVMRDGKIIDPQFAADRAAALDGQRRDSELLTLLWDNEQHAQFEGMSIRNLIEQACRGYELSIPFISLLEMMHGLDKVGKLPQRYVLPSIEDFCRAQAVVSRTRKNK
jgi:Fe-S-cluster containining protein